MRQVAFGLVHKRLARHARGHRIRLPQAQRVEEETLGLVDAAAVEANVSILVRLEGQARLAAARRRQLANEALLHRLGLGHLAPRQIHGHDDGLGLEEEGRLHQIGTGNGVQLFACRLCALHCLLHDALKGGRVGQAQLLLACTPRATR